MLWRVYIFVLQLQPLVVPVAVPVAVFDIEDPLLLPRLRLRLLFQQHLQLF